MGVGALVAFSGRDAGQVGEQGAASKTERVATEERRVPARDLLAAYRFDSPHAREASRRRQKLIYGGDPPHVARQKGDWETPEERAAKVTDFVTTMQERVELVDQGKDYDYMFCKAVIRRWLEEEPEVCMAWLGRMEMRTGWGDPFSELAEGPMGADPVRMLELMGNGWLERNRGYALKNLAERMAKKGVAEIPAALELLRESEREKFLDEALFYAGSEDVAAWLEVIDADDEKRLKKLASKCLGRQLGQFSSPKVDWQQRSEAVMAAVAGTPGEKFFQDEWAREQYSREKARLEAMVETDPKQAVELLVEMRVASGDDPEAARRRVVEDLSSRNNRRVEKWGQKEWEVGLQEVVMGENSLVGVLGERLGKISSELPPELHDTMGGKAVRDTLLVSPGETTAFVLSEGRGAMLEGPLKEFLRDGNHTKSVGATVLREVIENEGWESVPGIRPLAVEFARGYLEIDRERASKWLGTLPPDVAAELERGSE